MISDLAIRSMLVDKTSGKYLKAVEQRDLCDYISLFTKEKENIVVICDFSPAVKLFHEELSKAFGEREDSELMVKRTTVFNTWIRLKTSTNEVLLNNGVLQIIKDSEEAVNWIKTRLPKFKEAYQQAKEFDCNKDKTSVLKKISNEIDGFFEMILCNIHATAMVDIGSFKNNCIIYDHCVEITKFIKKLLLDEVGKNLNGLDYNSFLYQCVIEDMDINKEILFYLVDLDKSPDELFRELWDRGRATEDERYDDGASVFTTHVRWHKANDKKIDRVKLLIMLLQKSMSLLELIRRLKDEEVVYDDSSDASKQLLQYIDSLTTA